MFQDKKSIEMAIDCTQKMQETMFEMSFLYCSNGEVENGGILTECAYRLNDVLSNLDKELKKTKTYKPKN